MGRNTPSLRVIVNEYVERMRRIAEILPPDERSFLEDYLEDLDSTLSICMHTGVADPLEVFLVHLIRKVSKYSGKTSGE
ncbi:MAG: hypothetical protein QXE10_02465 [Desulfurococcaceae archaeon]|jgi:RNAse (barnase) inhibitor barstar